MTGDGGGTVIVSGRDGIDKIRDSGKFPYAVRVSWRYNARPDGYPDQADELLMERADNALRAEFDKDRCAWLVAVYTGDGARDWIFYTGNLNIFGKVFNRALADIETIPLVIDAQSDPDWLQYQEMRTLTYIPPSEDE